MRSALSVVAGVGLGLTFSQFPEYSQQYEQRLGGAVDELAIITRTFDRAAAEANLTREQALDTYRGVGNAFLSGQGADMEANFVRYARLSSHLIALEKAGPVDKLVGFSNYYDAEIGQRAFDAYNPAVPVTAEGFVYAGAGVMVGYGVFSAALAFLGRFFGFGRRKKARHTA